VLRGFLHSCFRHRSQPPFHGTVLYHSTNDATKRHKNHKTVNSFLRSTFFVSLVPLCGTKTKCATLSKLKAAQSVVLELARRLSLGWRVKHVHALVAGFCIPMIDWRSINPRSAFEMFYQISHSCECGAFRFLLWWLFLHRRLRFGNEAQLSLSRFAPFGGSLPLGATRFYPNGSRKSRNFL
jgi:hypothetical protein